MTASQPKTSHQSQRGHHKVKMPTLRSALHQEDQIVSDQNQDELRQRHPSNQSAISTQDASTIDLVRDPISPGLMNGLFNNHRGEQIPTSQMDLNGPANIVTLTSSNPTSPKFDQHFIYLSLPNDEELVDVLHSHGCYESEVGLQRRKDLIHELDTLVKQWIRSISLSRGFNWQIVEQAGGKIVTYGSYKLGVVGTSGDMDVLCIAPQHIDRNDFFNSLFSQLRRRSQDITELRSLPDAFVPVIKMKFKGIDVDLTFASLHFREIPDDDRFLHSAPMAHPAV